jgi:salicylate hydroxylase
VEGDAGNAKRFHHAELAHAEGARAYVTREWTEEGAKERYEWLFSCDVTTVSV